MACLSGEDAGQSFAYSAAADGPSPKLQFIAPLSSTAYAAGPTALPALVWGGSGRTAGRGFDEREARFREGSAIWRGSKG